jgi:hypothetical protein
VEAASCAMGTGGCDIVEVLKLLSSGELKKLAISHTGYRETKEYDGMGSTPRLDIKNGQLISWYVIYAKQPGKPKHGWTRTFYYRWKEDRFVIDHISETPPIESNKNKKRA